MTARTSARRAPVVALIAFSSVLTSTAAGQCLTQEFQGSESGTLDRFGSAVNIDGDKAVIGSAVAQDGYVFTLRPSGWEEARRLVPNDPQPNARFGRQLDVSGVFVVAGASARDEGGAQDAGAAYVFDETVSAYAQVAKLLPATSVAGARFGESVTIDGERIAVGSPGADSGDGRIHVFEHDNGVWTEVAILQASGAQAAFLGEAASIDLVGDLLVAGSAAREAVFVFEPSGTGWSQVQELTASDGEGGDSFGAKLALDGDVIIVGAPGDRSNRGSAYVFERSGSDFVEVQKIFPVGGQQTPQMFGSSVDVDGVRALVGAPGEGPRGAAYAFEREAGGWEGTIRLDKGGPALVAQFGTAVAIGGLDGLITAPFTNLESEVNSGSAVAVDLDGPGRITRYCLAGTNSSGREAKLRATGTLGVAANDFRLRVIGGMPNQFGVFCYAALQDQTPFGDGFLCLQAPFYRLWPIQVTNASGNAARDIDFDAPPASAGPGEITAGSTWNFQFWYRDPGSTGAGFNMSSGLSVTFCP